MTTQLNNKVVLLALVLLVGTSALAEDTVSPGLSGQNPKPEATGSETTGSEATGSKTGEADGSPQREAQNEPAPENATATTLNETPRAENLKNRDLGAAFRAFKPSEEISADNAVPYPVDI